MKYVTRPFTPDETKRMFKAALEGRSGNCNDPEAVRRELGLSITTGPEGTRVIVGSVECAPKPRLRSARGRFVAKTDARTSAHSAP